MRLVVVLVLAGLVASPLSASAQDAEESTIVEPSTQEPESPPEPAPEEPAPEEPALQLKLDDAGVEVVPSPPGTVDGYTLEEMDIRVRRALIGLSVSLPVFVAGLAMTNAALINTDPFICIGECIDTPDPNWVAPVGWTGAVLYMGGLAGIVASSVLLARRNQARRVLREAYNGRPARHEESGPSLRGPRYRPH